MLPYKTGAVAVWTTTLRLIAVLVLAAAQITTPPAAAGGPSASGGGHFVSHGFVGHNRFANHFRRKFAFHRVLIAPFGWGWPYDDYGDSYGNNITVITYPPPAPPADASSTASACERTTETFTVPSADGGTREIKVVSCP